MKITVKDIVGTPIEYEIDSYVLSKLNGDDYGTGELERMDNEIHSLKTMCAQLLNVLAEKQLITTEDIEKIFNGFRY